MTDVAERFGAPSAEEVAGWVHVLSLLGTEAPWTGDAERIDQLRRLEELKAAAAAAQARITVAFDRSQRAQQEESGVPAADVGTGVAAQVALARRDSPAKGSRHLGLAQALVHEMPCTLSALSSGLISEWRATLVVRETACLSRRHRTAVDAELATRPGGLGALGDAAVAGEARRIAYRLDPHAVTARARRAAGERRVTIRPAPDTTTFVTGVLPVVQGVAVYAELSRHAQVLRSSGDERSRGQIMADTLVERITGQASPAHVAVEVNVVMSEQSLLSDDPEPAQVEGYGPVPAPLARDWLRETAADVWPRRLYSSPGDGSLVAMDSVRRRFTGKLRRFVVVRDQTCRTSWCDAPIRHVDHLRPASSGGATSATNAQRLCEACNYAKEAAGWRSRARHDGCVETRTPTGHRYLSRRRALPGAAPPAWQPPPTRAEISFQSLILTA